MRKPVGRWTLTFLDGETTEGLLFSDTELITGNGVLKIGYPDGELIFPVTAFRSFITMGE